MEYTCISEILAAFITKVGKLIGEFVRSYAWNVAALPHLFIKITTNK